MTEAEQAWKMLSESAVAARLGGITSESSDVVDDADITEGRINPHAAGRTAGQRGGTGAMPPMMMGGAGGAQAGAAQSGASTLPAGLGAAGSAGTSGVAAGAHGAPPGGVMAAGGTNPDGTPSGLYSGTGASEGTAGSDAVAGTHGAGGRHVDGYALAGTHGAGGQRVDGYAVEPEHLRRAATGWQAIAHIMGEADQAMQIPHDLGFANVAQGPTNELSQLTKHYAQQASNEFVAIDRRLHGAAGEYDERELNNARLANEAGRTSK
ncbi:hypothetical protein [uncultured Tessaracoccus sp.]|uniref:hypothetical protein n=1 Tax=uncultured Tessaracoccus sp. TaxID=905023 RepID=UPI00260BDBB7|nr:hypothetical protein [uncultured Tessaracoccus sp.]